MKIYMMQTINLIAATNLDAAQEIVNNSAPKQLKGENYYFIVNERIEEDGHNS